MKNKKKNGNKVKMYQGVLGFVGLFGLRFFTTGDPRWLMWFGFFAFFANFWLGRISTTKSDERYADNVKTAMAFTGQLAFLTMTILFILAVIFPSLEILMVGITAVWLTLFFGYVWKLYRLEVK
jgi:hypothetical protein